jgi:hypothetical protein
MRDRDRFTTSEVEQLEQVRLACPDIARACDLARVFRDLVPHQATFAPLLPGGVSSC